MTNPAAAMKMLITYAICIPLAIFLGYLLTNPMDYGTLGFLAFVVAALLSPVFIKWHYPIMLFGIGCPIMLFFLPTSPPTWQAVVAMSLTISIVERTLSNERRFISVPAMTMPLMFLLGVILVTMQLAGGIGFHQLGGSVGGGKKYIFCLLGIATFFALISREIPANRRRLYITLYFGSAALDILGDVFPHLPTPLNYGNLLIQASSGTLGTDVAVGVTRLGMVSAGCNALAFLMLAKFGLRGIVFSPRVWRLPAFCLLVTAAQLGGFREALISFMIVFTALFILERLYQTRLLPVLVMAGIMGLALLVPLAKHLPYVYQRCLAVLPLDLDASVRIDAQGSSEWRLAIWQALTPQIPTYLLLGKGYALSAGDFQLMATSQGVASGLDAAGQLDASQGALALAGDYHSGPFSTIIPFGIWGAIGMTWLMSAAFWVVYRNYRYGDPELRTINTFLLALQILEIIMFLFIFGAFELDIGYLARTTGFSVALNGGVRRPQPQPAAVPRIKPLPQPQTA